MEGNSIDNYLLLVMATVRYDAYCESNTPNFDIVGKPIKTHAPTCVSSGLMIWEISMVIRE